MTPPLIGGESWKQKEEGRELKVRTRGETRADKSRRLSAKVKFCCSKVSFREDSLQKVYTQAIQESVDFSKVCGAYAEATRTPDRDVDNFANGVSAICWQTARDVLCSEGPLGEARAELQKLRQRLCKCHLAAMRQIDATKEAFVGAMNSSPHRQRCPDMKTVLDNVDPSTAYKVEDLEAVTFHEPLQHLDVDHRHLVIAIVLQKLRQVESGNIPPSLLEALMEGARSGSGVDHARNSNHSTSTAAKEEIEELQQEVKELASEVEELREELDITGDRLAEALQKSEATQCELWGIKTQVKELKTREMETQAEITRMEAEVQTLTEENESADIRLNLAEELGKERAEKAEQERQILEKERDKFEEDRRRRMNAKEVGTQTDLCGKDVDEQSAQNKRLRVMMEEMQMKFKELVTQSRTQGVGNVVDNIVQGLGLGCVIGRRAVFERLYNDAMERVKRLEELRVKILAERQDIRSLLPQKMLHMVPGIPVEGSVLTTIEQSPLQGMVRLVPWSTPTAPGPPAVAMQPPANESLNASESATTHRETIKLKRMSASLVLQSKPLFLSQQPSARGDGENSDRRPPIEKVASTPVVPMLPKGPEGFAAGPGRGKGEKCKRFLVRRCTDSARPPLESRQLRPARMRESASLPALSTGRRELIV